ncbi:S8 family serine peptidase [Streptomyces sp. NPDC026673]|uniref:S8 family serine peptidase n=1 Tax=Streptomyces sp. NPDC026673 TaxID=3155724 RepID=UPI0033CCA924
MEWAVRQDARIVNMSLASGISDRTDLLSTKVNELSAGLGPLFVVTAGNSGTTEPVEAPGAADAALAVTSTIKRGTSSSVSSRGPPVGNFGLKPVIPAPGEEILAARAGISASTAGKHPVRRALGNVDGQHVAGAAAIVAGEHPDWTGTPDQGLAHRGGQSAQWN